MIETWRTRLRELSARQAALIGAFLLLGVSGAALLWPDEAEPVVILQQEVAPAPVTEIAGLATAAQKLPLRNPFTSAHETFGEIPAAMETNKVNAAPLDMLAVPASSAPLPPTSAGTLPPAPMAQPILLRGVVTGADGVRLAILAKGAESAALAIGETWQGHTLRGLTDTSATLDTVSGSITVTRE